MAQEKAVVFRTNDLVFIPDEEEGYIPANVVSEFSAGQEGEVTLCEGRQNVQLSKKQTVRVERMDAQSFKDLPDMIKIKMLNEASLLHNLKLRYFKEPRMDIYTNIGAILVAINPFTDLGLYTQEMEDKYLTAGPLLAEAPPHIFKVAEAAMTSMKVEDRDQSCVITGESGAGKTETTKRFLQYISEKSRRNREHYGGDFGVDTEKLRQQILDSNPFMEAFGNAKTLRNDNSSRFGKLIDMSFEPSKGVVVGCSITNYLLEKSRVVKVSKGERNYHIFYQLCFASRDIVELKKKYHLQSADMFRYCLGMNDNLNELRIPGESDAEIFKDTKLAMEKLNMSEDDIDVTFRICSAILHIGNIEFAGESKDLAEFKPGVADTALNFGAELIGVDPSDLAKAILERSLIGNTVKQHTVQEAEQARDALSKFVYEKLFDWLISKMNHAMEQGGTGKRRRGTPRSLAVLDIFGFETFFVNSFEQLCINFCNEQLQAFFNLHVFKKEQKEYEEEGIDVATIGFYDNQGVIDAIGTGKKAVMVICDDLCGLEAANDQLFLSRINGIAVEQKAKDAHRHFLFKPKVQDMRKVKHYATAFVVRHFAGLVHYNVEGFIEKNKDQLRRDIRTVLAESKLHLVKGMFPDGGDGNAGKQGKFRNTLGKKFQGSLKRLMNRLNKTTPQFVRCIKPNDEKKPNIFTAAKVYKQLNEAGLVEVCKIRKLGYPIKKTHKQFMNDYLCIAKSATSVQDLCNIMMKEKILFQTNNSPNWQVGKTKVFLRSEQLYILESKRGEALREVLAIIHRFARRFLFRYKVNLALKAIKDIKLAIKNKDPELLEKGLMFYEEKGPLFAKLPIVVHGKEMMKELRVKLDLINDLKVAIDNQDFSTIRVKLEVAKELGMEDHAFVLEARGMLEKMEVQKQVNNKLQSAIGDQEVEKLEKAIEYAIKNGYGGIKLCGQAERMLKTLKERASRLELLEKELEKSNLDVDEIARLIKELREFGCSDDHPLIVKAARAGDLIIERRKDRERQIKQLEKQLEKHLSSGDYHKLQDLVAAAVKLQYNGELVKEASKMIQGLQQRQELLDEVGNASRVLVEKSKLPDGIKESDLVALKHAIKTAIGVNGLNLNEEIQVVEGDRLLERMEEQLEAQDELALVLENKSNTSLYKMLEKVQALGLQTRDADKLVQRVREMELKQAKADALTNNAQVKEIIAGLVEPSEKERVTHLRKRVEAMYKQEFKDTMEKVWNSKDLAMRNYYKVRADADFVSKERSENRETRKQMKHAYEENWPLTKSLLELDDLQEQKAIQISQTISKLCDGLSGNRKDTMESAMSFVTCHGIADPVIADEIYIQLAKHLTANPNPLSKTKGWHLLALCATYFAPQPRFLPYVLAFLHNTVSDVGLEGNYARYVVAQISASTEFKPVDVNFKPSKKEIKAFFERPPVLMQLALVNGQREDVPVPPDFTLADAAKLIRKRTKIMIDLQNPEWAIYIKATAKPPKLTWKTRLENFYRYYKPENLGNVDQILSYYKGHEEALFKELTSTSNYGPEPTPSGAATMNQLRRRGKSTSKGKKRESTVDVDDLLADDDDRKSEFSVSSKSSIGSAISKVGSVISKFFKRARGYTNVNIDDIDLPNPKIAWALPWWIYIGDTVNSLYEQNLIPVLTYRRRLCKNRGRPDENLFLQLKRDFLDGQLLPKAQQDVAFLSVIILALRLIKGKKDVPYGEKNKLLKAGLLKAIPKPLKRANKRNEEWLDAFVEVASDQSTHLQKMTKRELQNAFFQKVIELPTYGMSYFFAQILKNNAKSYIAKAQTDEHEGAVKVGINQFEISLFENEELTHSYLLEDITKFVHDGTTITLKVKKPKKKEAEGKTNKKRKSLKRKKSLRRKMGNTMANALKKVIGNRTDTLQLYTLQTKEMYDLIYFFKNLPAQDED